MITLINYLIVGIAFLVIIWIVDRFLGLGAGIALLSGLGGGGTHGNCGSCQRYTNSKCIDSPGETGNPMGFYGNDIPR